MKAVLTPIYFPRDKTDRFATQLERLRSLLGDVAELTSPIPLGEIVPADADAAVFPEIVGEAYRRAEDFRNIVRPILVVTSEFATFSMWDWEIMNFLKGHGVGTLAPRSLDMAKLYCRALGARRAMRHGRFLMFQDNPGEGFQPEIFKSFYWWEESCRRRLREKFGLTVELRSLADLGKKAAARSDADALAEWKKWDYPASDGFGERRAAEAAKLYLALRDEIDSPDVIGMGTNCLNESTACRTTPCVAGDRLFAERGVLWSCEADTVSLATMFILHRALEQPLMMSNIYPFLMGPAATKHEKIPGFPEVADRADDHILMGHCGYFGFIPRAFAENWLVREKALAIVDDDAHVIDGRLRPGEVTLAKLDASMEKMMAVPGRLKGYVQYDRSSDCRNGGVVMVENGKRFLDRVYSHHLALVEGEWTNELEAVGRIMDLEVEHF